MSDSPGRGTSCFDSEAGRAHELFILITAEKENKYVPNIPSDADFCQPGEISPRLVAEVEGLCCQLLAITGC